MTLLTKVLHRWDDIEKLRKGEMVPPRFVDFHSSNICNMHCVGCQYAGRLSKDYMSEEDQFAVVDKFLKIGVKAFDFCGGGEPLIPPYMDKLLRHVRKNGAWVGLLSNGSVMTANLMSAIIDCACYIRISLEASNPEDYTLYKGVHKSMWDRVLDNIRALQQVNSTTGSQLEVSVKFAVSKTLKGQKHYEDAIALGKSLHAERITFRAIRDSVDQLSEVDKIWENKILERVLERLPPDTRKHISYWLVPVPFSQVPQCWLNPLHAMVQCNGDMHVCCYGYYRPEQLYLGNIIKQSFEEIWFSQKHWDVIKGIKREDCARVDCKFFNHHKSVEQNSIRETIEWL